MKKHLLMIGLGLLTMSLAFTSCKEETAEPDNTKTVDLENIGLSGTSWDIVELDVKQGNMSDGWSSYVASDWQAGNRLYFNKNGKVSILRQDEEQPTFYEDWTWNKSTCYLVIGDMDDYPMEGTATLTMDKQYVYLKWNASLGNMALPVIELELKRAISEF